MLIDTIPPYILLVATLSLLSLLSLVGGWWLGRRSAPSDETNEDALLALQQSLDSSREESRRLALDNARLSERAAQQQATLESLKQNEQQLRQQAQQLQASLATEQEARQQESRSNTEKLALLQESREQLLKEFENLSQKIFEQKQRQFAEQSQQGLTSLLTPFREQLEGLRKKVEDVYVADVKDRTSLKEQINELHKLNQQMSAEAHALTTALRGEKKMQGNWGELLLETVLEQSGLREGEEFERESSQENDEGRRYRPDVLIRLPDNKHIIIDSKVSLNAYTDFVNAEDDATRERAGRQHCEAVRQHIRSLSEKAYQQLKGINSPDFVFMFMPVEPAFMMAFQSDSHLFTEAFEKRIVVVTPTTLLATLRTVASLWAIERRNQSTEKLAEQAGKIYDKLAIVVERLETLGKQLGTVNNTYDETWKALKGGRGNLISQADQFRKLGVRVKKDISRTLTEDAEAEHMLGSEKPDHPDG